MGNKYIFKNIVEVEAISTTHGIGQKRILANQENCRSNLMQAAYSSLKSGEKVEEHIHPTMEEFYYFEKGESDFHIEGKIHLCRKGDFIMIPAGIKHFLEAKSDVCFIYWSIRI